MASSESRARDKDSELVIYPWEGFSERNLRGREGKQEWGGEGAEQAVTSGKA